MKYLNHIFVGILIVSILGAFFVFSENFFLPNEQPVACTMDAMVCPDGSAVGRTRPNCEFAACPSTPVVDGISEHIQSKADLIVVESPLRDTVVTSPLTITGKARGYWFFEASFPISVVNWDGLIIGQGIATAQDEWMTEDFVPFTAKVEFTVATDTPYRRGAIILQKDNPSDLPEHDNALEIPVKF